MSSGSLQTPTDPFAFRLERGRVCLTLDTRVYRQTAIQKAGYRLAKLFNLVLGGPEGFLLRATLVPVAGASISPEDLVTRFFRELCDQELREQIAQETTDVRAVLLAHAFSRTDLLRRD